MNPFNRQGISPSDLQAMRSHFDAQGWNRDDHVFHYDSEQDRWEVFHVIGLAAESQTAKVARVLVYDLMDGWVAP